MLAVIIALAALWYAGAVALNWQVVSDARARADLPPDTWQAIAATLSHNRPLLPAPHQVVQEVRRSTATLPVTSRRSLVHHPWVTLSAALAGFALGVLTGTLAAVAIVHLRVLERA
ncbi:MAG TPA: hypothetical protein VGN83_28895 [Falsiroseomonas sp.]|nr:hypothetical protein [Falsiroseomonas sp.]